MDFQQVIIYTNIDIPDSGSVKHKKKQSNRNDLCSCLTFFAPLRVFSKPNEDRNRNKNLTEPRESLCNTFCVYSDVTSNPKLLGKDFLSHTYKTKTHSSRNKFSCLKLRYFVILEALYQAGWYLTLFNGPNFTKVY